MSTALANREQITQSLDTSNPVASMIQALTAHGITSDSAAALEKMTDLYMKVEAENARKACAADLAKLQSELPHIQATKAIPDNKGGIRSTFAPIDEIMKQLQPYLNRFNFSVSFDTDFDNGGITAICILTHPMGHKESRKFRCRTSPPPGTSPAQADAATLQLAKRYALCNMFNITIDHDTDGRADGDVVGPDVAKELEDRATACGNVDAFLRLAGVGSFKEITTGSLTVLRNALIAKEAAMKAKK